MSTNRKFAFLSSIFACLTAVAGRCDDSNVHLRVSIPYDCILQNEIVVNATVEIVNKGSSPIVVSEPGNLDRTQIVWVPWRKGKELEHVGFDSATGASYGRTPLELFSKTGIRSGMPTAGSISVRPGSRHFEDKALVGCDWECALQTGPDEIEPVFLASPGRIVRGLKVKVHPMQRRASDFPRVYYTNSALGRGSALRPSEISVRLVELNGERFLYLESGVRFCRLIPGMNYMYALVLADDEQRTISVRCADASVAEYRFGLREFRVLSGPPEMIPWVWAANVKTNKPPMSPPRNSIGPALRAPVQDS